MYFTHKADDNNKKINNIWTFFYKLPQLKIHNKIIYNSIKCQSNNKKADYINKIPAELHKTGDKYMILYT